jgi:two-component sensor histidine kinase
MELKLELESTPGAAAQARDELRVLQGRIPDHVLTNLLLVVTELVTNSVKFGPGVQIGLRLDVDDKSVTGLVSDGGHGRVAIRETPASEPGGFGLQIVDRLSASWGVRPGTSDVWFELTDGEAHRPRPARRLRVRTPRRAVARLGELATR